MADLNTQLGFCDRGVYLSGWRVTGQQFLTPNRQITTIDAIRNTIPRGAKVRAMVYLAASTNWPTQLRVWHGADNRTFCEALVAAGQEAVLDDRMSPNPLSSHHQKYVVVDSNDPAHTFAYVGGVDLCFDRWDTEAHASPAERQRDLIEIYTHEAVKLLGGTPLWLTALDQHVVSSYLPSQPGWHDVQARVAGPAVRQVWDTFAARWNDRRPANNVGGLESFRTGTPVADQPTAPAAAPGSCWVQVLQTLPCKNALPFAPSGEQTVLSAYRQAIDHAEHYIYIEDQYFWPCDLMPNLEAALRRGVLVLAVVARDFDLPGLSVVHQQMRARVINQLRQANAANFRILHLQQPAGGQIYVHAKTMIVDDAVAFIGSANFNHRSMTNDTELQLAIVDSVTVDVPFGGPDNNLQPVGRFVHDYRSRLWAEHLQVAPILVTDPIVTFNTLWASAPLPGGRAHPHGLGVAAPDTGFIAQFIANLLIDGNALPPLPFLLPPIAVGKDALAAAIQAALPVVIPAVMTWLELLLNPRLDC